MRDGVEYAIAAAEVEAQLLEVEQAPATPISHKVFWKSFCRSQLPHKTVNSFFIFVPMKDKLTDFVWELTFEQRLGKHFV